MIFVTDNQWDCSDGGLDWLAMKTENSTARQRIVDYKKLVCHQQLYKGKPLHIVMVLLRVSQFLLDVKAIKKTS